MSMSSQPEIVIWTANDRLIPNQSNGSDDLELAKTPSSNSGKVLLRIIDAPFDGSTPQFHPEICIGDDVAQCLADLPLHESGVARIIDFTVHSDFLITGLREIKGPKSTETARHAFIDYLQDTYGHAFQERQIFRWLDDPLLVNDVGSIAAQWTQRSDSDRQHLYRLVNRASLQQHPLDYDLRPRDSYLTCAQDASNRLIVVQVNDVWYDQSFKTSKVRDGTLLFHNPRMITDMSEKRDSWTSLADGSIQTFAKLLVLDFFSASIYLQPVDFFQQLIYAQNTEEKHVMISLHRNPHLQVPLGLFEPRLSAKPVEAFREIEDAEGILRSVNNLVDSVHFVREDLEMNSASLSGSSPSRDRRAYLQRRKALCDERQHNAARALDALNRQLDYLTKRHSIQEAISVKKLTILASIYLPLALAASMLSMSSSFEQMFHGRTVEEDGVPLRSVGTILMWDFIGLFVILACITIFILRMIRLGLWLKSHGLGYISKHFNGPFSPFYYGRKWEFGGKDGPQFKFLLTVTAWWMAAGFMIVLLAVVIVGMRSGNMVATAAAGFGVYGGIGVGLCFACFFRYQVLHRKSFRVR